MTLEEIKNIINRAVPQATVHIMDPMNDGQHLQAIVISPVFEDMPLIKQHQMIMKPLKDAMATSVHAMALKTFTPQKWAAEKHQFGFNQT